MLLFLPFGLVMRVLGLCAVSKVPVVMNDVSLNFLFDLVRLLSLFRQF